jgi:flagellar basal-body rod modification protein FlgD
MPLQWDGKNTAGQSATPGLYRLSAQAVINGKTATVPVNTLATVKSIVTNPSDGSVSVEVEGGKTLLLSDVKRVGI